MNLFFAFFALGWLVYAITETDFNAYKVAFWFVIGMLNMFNYIAYKWNGN